MRFRYQNKKNRNYFEGWYFRFVGNVNIGVIFALSKHKNDPHAFIQLFNRDSKECDYLRFDLKEFRYDRESQTVYIGEHSISNKEVHVNDIHIKISNHDIFSNKSAMSYLENAPLECFQEVLYMKADAEGMIGNKPITGYAYSEKTYGTNFPSKWIWIQSFNSDKDSKLSFSVGMVPILFFRFKGFFLLLDTEIGKFRLSSTNLSGIRLGETIILKKGSLKIELYPKKNHSVKLVGPSKGGLMNLDVFESLDSEVALKIFKKDKLIFEDYFVDAGMELMFDKE